MFWHHHVRSAEGAVLGMFLTHWGRVTHICVNNLTVIGSDNGLSPGQHQAIIWTNDGILLIGPLGTNFSEVLIEIHTFSLKKIHSKMSSGKWRPSCLCLNVLMISWIQLPQHSLVNSKPDYLIPYHSSHILNAIYRQVHPFNYRNMEKSTLSRMITTYYWSTTSHSMVPMLTHYELGLHEQAFKW